MKITIDLFFKISTVLYLALAVLVTILTPDGWVAGLCLVILAAMPILHEGAHWYIARDHGVYVDEILFIKGKTDLRVQANLTHIQIFSIAMAGAVIDLMLYSLIGILMGFYGVILLNNPLGFLGVVFPLMWCMSIFIENSDIRIGLRAWHNHTMQQGG